MQFWILVLIFSCASASRREFLSSAKYQKAYHTDCKVDRTFWEAVSLCSRDGRLFRPSSPAEVKDVSDAFKKFCHLDHFWTDVSNQKQGKCGSTWNQTLMSYNTVCSQKFSIVGFVCEQERTVDSDESNSSEERHKLLMKEIASLKVKVRRLG